MSTTTLLRSGSFETTTTPATSVSSTSSIGNVTTKAISFFLSIGGEKSEAPKTKGVDDFIAELCAEDPRLEAAIEEGNRWVARTFYAADGSIQKLRLEAGLSQASLATLLDTSQPYIANLEAGKIDVGITKVARLADALGHPRAAVFEMLLNAYERRHDQA